MNCCHYYSQYVFFCCCVWFGNWVGYVNWVWSISIWQTIGELNCKWNGILHDWCCNFCAFFILFFHWCPTWLTTSVTNLFSVILNFNKIHGWYWIYFDFNKYCSISLLTMHYLLRQYCSCIMILLNDIMNLNNRNFWIGIWIAFIKANKWHNVALITNLIKFPNLKVIHWMLLKIEQ